MIIVPREMAASFSEFAYAHYLAKDKSARVFGLG